MRTTSLAVALALLVSMTVACSSERVMVIHRPPADYEVIGRADGEATGNLLILFAAYNFIPVYLNSRTERAVDRALDSVPGATGLINVEISEDWYWWVLGSAKVVSIKGDAVRERR